jgi:uncharacterized membrane protein YphA (DoxX/SURF4 family)
MKPTAPIDLSGRAPENALATSFAWTARVTYGFAAILFGVTAFVWHDYDSWAQAQVLGKTSFAHVLLGAIALAHVVGGFALLLNRTMRLGAVLLGVVYLFFTTLALPRVFASPLVYDAWNNIFEQLSVLCGALLIYATALAEDTKWRRKWLRAGIVLFGLCVFSFALEQVFYLSATASLVPKWISPGQMFWAVATTVALALAGIAILSGWWATVAAQLFAVMILLFSLLIWFPKIVTDPQHHFNWTEGAESLAIAATAWLVADSLNSIRRRAST